MTDLPEPAISRAKPFPFVWIVPVVAILLGGYLVVKEFWKRGPRITITFQDGSGIESGRTVLQHNGMAIGLAESATLTEDLQRVEVVVSLQKSARGLAREGSRFWISRPEIGLQGISGLDTFFSGPVIKVTPGGGPVAMEFVGLERPPIEGSDSGTKYVLTIRSLGSLNVGSPILYRDFKIGEIVSTELAPDATAVLARINIETPYNKLVRTNSVFWNVSGIVMKVGLLGARIRTQSLESALAGGVMLATPEGFEDSEIAPENAKFQVHPEPKDEWLEWEPVIPLHSSDSVQE